MSNFSCTDCGKVMSNYHQVGYEGPKDRSDDRCDPFMAWEVLCWDCEELRKIHKGFTAAKREPSTIKGR